MFQNSFSWMILQVCIPKVLTHMFPPVSPTISNIGYKKFWNSEIFVTHLRVHVTELPFVLLRVNSKSSTIAFLSWINVSLLIWSLFSVSTFNNYFYSPNCTRSMKDMSPPSKCRSLILWISFLSRSFQCTALFPNPYFWICAVDSLSWIWLSTYPVSLVFFSPNYF